jgi:hypothetical protein
MDTGRHYCSACGEEHGGSSVSPDVEIARINAKRDVEVARIQRGEARTITALESETEIAVTAIEAAANVEVAAELAAADIGNAEEPETIPVIVDGTPAEEPEPEQTIEPAESSVPAPREPAKSKLSYW